MTESLQIPWAPSIQLETEYRYNQLIWVDLHYGAVKAGVQVRDGAVFAWNHWEHKILEYMRKDELLTRNLLDYMEQFRTRRLSPSEIISRWIRNVPPKYFPYGKKEWRPDSWDFAKPEWNVGYLKIGDYIELAEHHVRPVNVSRAFWYAHFMSPQEGNGLIMSTNPSFENAQVLFGDVEKFLEALNEFSQQDPEAPARINRYFENGILWVLDYLGRFESDQLPYLPEWAKKALGENPDLLWPDLVARLKDQELDPWMKEVVRTWMLKHGIPEKDRD